MIKFGTGGWRAVIGEEFTKENVCLVAQGLADYIKDKKSGNDADESQYKNGEKLYSSNHGSLSEENKIQNKDELQSKSVLEQKSRYKPIIVGGDRRFLSDSATRWIAEVLAANGLKVILISRSVPTPFIMHYVLKNGLDFGLEVTASHNPAKYNGIK